jgi:hypothetical protein
MKKQHWSSTNAKQTTDLVEKLRAQKVAFDEPRGRRMLKLSLDGVQSCIVNRL